MSDHFRVAARLLDEGRGKDGFFVAASGLNEEPDSAQGHHVAGRCAQAAGYFAAARPHLRQSIRLDPKPAPMNDLGRAYHDDSDHDSALRWFKRSAILDPADTAPTCNAALIYLNEGQFDDAERWSQRARATNPAERAVYDNLALSLLAKGRFQEGWSAYERSIGIERRMERVYGDEIRWLGPDQDRMVAQFGGQPTRTLMIYGEQGVGDEILHSACIPDVLADGPGEVSIETRPGLEGLFRRSFPKIHRVTPTRFESVRATGLDARVSMAVLGQWYRKTTADYDRPPHLVADPERRAAVRGLLSALPGKKVGIAWTGGTPSTRQRDRSTTLDAIYNQLKHLPVTLVSLEYKEPDLSGFPKVRHFPWMVNTPDYDDTAALVAELDCVVSVTTSVAHLAGGLGVPVFILVPEKPNWKYSVETNPGSRFYWWRSARLIRQSAGRWNLEPVRQFLRKGA